MIIDSRNLATVDLNEDQIDVLLDVLKEKRNDLDVVLKNSDGLEITTVHELQMQHRDINDIIRELQFYAVIK